MARPKKAPDDALTERLRLRVSLDEKQRIEAKAAEAKLSVSEYVRRASLGAKISTAPRDLSATRMDAETLAELNRWGVNLNQIAKHMNRGGDSPAALDQVLFQLYQLIETVGRKV